MAKKKKPIEVKWYVRKTKVAKDLLLNDFNAFLEKLNDFQKYPCPIYEILMEGKNEQILGVLGDEKQLDVYLESLKGKEKKLRSNKSTTDFIYAINENQTLFNFDLSKPTDKYQDCIGKNLRNLINLKMSLSYLDSFEKFYNEFLKFLDANIQKDDEELQQLKIDLLNLNINAYTEFLSIKFSIEKDFNFQDLIVNLQDVDKIKQFKFNMQEFDKTLKSDELLSDFIIKHVNPRIDLIINSFKEIIDSKIELLEKHTSEEVSITEEPFSEFYIFICEIGKYILHGYWNFKDIIKNQLEEVELMENENIRSEEDIITNSKAAMTDTKEDKEKETLVEVKEVEEIKHIILIDSINQWILKKTDSQSTLPKDFEDFIKNELLHHSLDYIKTIFHNFVLDCFKFVTTDYNLLVSLPNFPLTIPKKYKEIETAEENDTTLDIIIKIEKDIDNIQKLLNLNDFFTWVKDEKLIYSIINPWISLINTINYLKSEKPKIKNFELPFWDQFIELYNKDEKILDNDLAETYLKELYKKYEESKNLFKYKILFNDILNVSNITSDYQHEIFNKIETLFNESRTASVLERDIISNIKTGMLINRDDLKYEEAKKKLIEQGIIKEVKTNIFGVI